LLGHPALALSFENASQNLPAKEENRRSARSISAMSLQATQSQKTGSKISVF